jgi:predicted Fe-Mo cluster-binding NifX family protein
LSSQPASGSQASKAGGLWALYASVAGSGKPIINTEPKEIEMDIHNAKIAVVTDDGVTVSSHFGRAQYYEVLTFQNGQQTGRERRAKFSPHAQGHSEEEGHHHGHNHEAMIDPIGDCQVVIARGMGDGAYTHLTTAGFTTFLTELHSIDEVARAVTSGGLQHDKSRIHHKQHSPS